MLIQVKTTSQIVAELAQRKGDAQLAKRADSLTREIPVLTIDDDKRAHIRKFLDSQPEDDIIVIDDDDASSEIQTITPSNPTPVLLGEILPGETLFCAD